MGPIFFCCSKMAVTRRRSKLWWRKAHQSKALVELQRSRSSKRDLKPSGTHFLIFWPLRDDFLTFEMSKNMFPGIFFGVDICNPKLFAITNRLSIAPSLQNIQNILFLLIIMSKKMSFSKKCRKSILTSATIRKKIRWIQWCNPFCLKPSKMTCFGWFAFLIFFIFFICSIICFGFVALLDPGGGHRFPTEGVPPEWFLCQQ